ncbi:MAG TPA: hypothetical protein VMH61_06745 [Candidatus Acidoferrales bacterium]|nr:hypothetical protein [Candidatus Acidoferrales bacterium]
MLAVLAYRAADVVAGVLPARAADALAVLIARAAYALHLPARRFLEANLSRVLPGLPATRRRALGRAAFVSFARGFARFLRGPHPLPPGRVRIEGAEHLALARASGRGVILLSAHVGDWELGAACIASQGIPLHLAARRQREGAIEALFARRRLSDGVRVLPAEARFVLGAAALRRGEWIALMADRAPARAHATSVCAWAAALARRTGALVLPAVCVSEPDGSRVLRIEAPIPPARCREGAFADTLRGWLERWPGQWAAFEPVPEGIA